MLERLDDHTLTWGLGESANLFPCLRTFVGNMVQPLSPARIAGSGEPRLEFDLMAIADIAADLWDQHKGSFGIRSKLFPKMSLEYLPLDHHGQPLVVSDKGTACASDDGKVKCPLCTMRVKKLSLRAHVGSHILAEAGVTQTENTCGFCGGNSCTYAVDGKHNAPTFNCPFAQPYKKKSACSDKSQCRNVLVECPACATDRMETRQRRGKTATHVWGYNIYEHWHKHPGVLSDALEFKY
eukprot:GHVU01030148.1.p1 GENE.GHVU01030148.1~~GHVU01030148.1.p1  ORF type:complete len:239 (-),score=19.72 GHVU01030148.1:155-871(-)